MLKTEKNYEFRKRLLQIHKPNLKVEPVICGEDELLLGSCVKIIIPQNAGEVIVTAVKDLSDYLRISMGASSWITPTDDGVAEESVIRFCISKDLGDYASYMGYRIVTDDAVNVYGYDERAIAQAVYYLEDQMSHRRAPVIAKGTVERKPSFSPRMVHSGFGLDQYPNEYLRSVAHAGMDAILIFVKGINRISDGFLDFNDLISRAARYGIDVYAYCKFHNTKHPDEDGAYAFYDGLYGELFRQCPGFKGVIFVGESLKFPSKDEHVEVNSDSIFPTGKPKPGWWPCKDYPQWISMISDVIRKQKQDADIVFWTYNWAWTPEAERLRLIRELPKDISLLVTFELPETYQSGDVRLGCCDYTLSFEGPSKVFESEAKAAKENGLRLYSMTNTAGLTWDLGVIPYEPMPFQWMKRYQNMLEAQEKWGLCGIMESHHYGFWPSFVSEIAKNVFSGAKEDMQTICRFVLETYYGWQQGPEVEKALRLWSEAITYYAAVNEHQYVSFRIGPSYPFCLDREFKPPAMPHAVFGNNIFFGKYGDVFWYNRGTASLPAVRHERELQNLQKMRALMDEGVAILQQIPDQNEDLEYLINLGKFISCCITTGIHSKQWFMLTTAMKIERDKQKAIDLIAEIEALAKAEMQNAENAIPLVQKDSRLGWEPSMEYMTDADRIRWKIKHLQFVLDSELAAYKRSASV